MGFSGPHVKRREDGAILALRAQTWGAPRRELRLVGAQAEDGFCEPHVGAKRGRSQTERIPLRGSARCHSGSASQARFHREGDTYSPAPVRFYASEGSLALAVGSCFLCLLSLQQQRK